MRRRWPVANSRLLATGLVGLAIAFPGKDARPPKRMLTTTRTLRPRPQRPSARDAGGLAGLTRGHVR